MAAPQSSTVEDWQLRLEEGDRWLEVVEGRLIRLGPPDEVHGNIVRNLSAAIGRSLRERQNCYACYELGLILTSDPATVRCPAVSCFPIENGFAEMDELATDHRPLLIVEIASTANRREGMADRVRDYLSWGAQQVWVVDPHSRHLHDFVPNLPGRMYKETETFRGDPALPYVEFRVGDLFADPAE